MDKLTYVDPSIVKNPTLPIANKEELNTIVTNIQNQAVAPPKTALDKILTINQSHANNPFIQSEKKQPNEFSYTKPIDVAYAEVAPGKYVPRYEKYLSGYNNEEINAKQQSGWEQMAYGVGKNAIKAVGYALDSTIGFVAGTVNAIEEGKLSAFYNNDFSKWIEEQNKRLDYKLPNYVTEHEKNMSWVKAMAGLNTNFWFNDVLGGVAFMAGAIGGEAVWAAATGGSSIGLATAKWGLRAGRAAEELGATTRAMRKLAELGVDSGKAGALASSVKYGKVGEAANLLRFTATSVGFEAGVEARQSLDESIANYQDAIQKAYGRNPTMEEYQKFIPDAVSKANNVFLTNAPLLAVSNVIMFGGMFGIGKGMSKSISEGIGRTFGVGINTIDEGGKVVYKALEPTKMWKNTGRVAHALSKPLTEGVWEEGLQSVISQSSQNYLAAKYDPSSLKKNYDMMDAFYDAMAYSYGTNEGMKQVGIGMIIGAFGGSRGAVKGYNKALKDQAPQAAALQDAWNKTTNAGANALKNMLSVAQLQATAAKSNKLAGNGDLTPASIAFNQSQLAKMELEHRNGKLGESVDTFNKSLDSMDTASLIEEFKIDGQSEEEITAKVNETKQALKDEYATNVKIFKLARASAETHATPIKTKDGKLQDYTSELTANIFLGLKAQDRSVDLANTIEAMTGKNGIASNIELYNNISKERKNSLEAIRLASKRVKALDEEYIALQQDFSTLQETAPRTTENNQHAQKLEANRRKAAKTLGVLQERQKELDELKASAAESPLFKDLAFNSISKTKTSPSIDDLLTALDELDNFDGYLAELKKRNPKEAQVVEHLLGEYKANQTAFVGFNNVYDKLADQRHNFSSYKGILGVFNTKERFKTPLVSAADQARFDAKIEKGIPLTEDEQHKVAIEEYIKASSLSEYDAFNIRLLADLSNALYTVKDATLIDFSDPIEENVWNEFVSSNTVSDELKNSIAEKLFNNTPLSRREERIYDTEKNAIDDAVKLLKKTKGDSIRKARKVVKPVMDTSLNTTAGLRKLISDIMASKNYLQGLDVNHLTEEEVPTEEDFREINKLEDKKAKKPLSAKLQQRYNELKEKINKWGAIEGTFSGKYKLGELYAQLFTIEQSKQEVVTDEHQSIPLTETMSEAEEESSDKIPYDVLQTYDKAMFKRVENEKKKVHYEISNVSLKEFLRILFNGGAPQSAKVNGVEVDVSTITLKRNESIVIENDGVRFTIKDNDARNLKIDKASKDAINALGTILITRTATDNMRLPTSYNTLLMNVDGKAIPVPTDFERDADRNFDVAEIQNLAPGAPLSLEVPNNKFNQSLLADYKKAKDKAKALITLAKNLVIRSVDGTNEIGVLKAERELQGAKNGEVFKRVSEIRKKAAEAFLASNGDMVDLNTTVTVQHVYIGHPVLDATINQDGTLTIQNNPFTQDTVKNVVDIGFIENGKVHLKNDSKVDVSSFIKSVQANKKGKYDNKRVAIIVFTFNGMNVAYPVNLIPTVIDVSGEVDAIMNTQVEEAEKASNLNLLLMRNGIDVQPLQITSGNLNKAKIDKIKSLLSNVNKFVSLSDWLLPETDMEQTLIENASIHLDLRGDVFHSPKVVLDFGEPNEEVELFEGVDEEAQPVVPTQEVKVSDVDIRRNSLPDSQVNTRTTATQIILDYFAEVVGIPKFTENLDKGTYIGWLRGTNNLGDTLTLLLEQPKRAFDEITKYSNELSILSQLKSQATPLLEAPKSQATALPKAGSVGVGGEDATTNEVSNNTLKDIESTGTALGNLDIAWFDDFQDKFGDEYKSARDVSEAYHKAKLDDTNPELVKTVEDLLLPKEQGKTEEEVGSVGVGGDVGSKLEKPYKTVNDGSGKMVKVVVTTTEKNGVKTTKFKTQTTNKQGESREQNDKGFNTFEEAVENLGIDLKSEENESALELIQAIKESQGKENIPVRVTEIREGTDKSSPFYGKKVATLVVGGEQVDVILEQSLKETPQAGSVGVGVGDVKEDIRSEWGGIKLGEVVSAEDLTKIYDRMGAYADNSSNKFSGQYELTYVSVNTKIDKDKLVDDYDGDLEHMDRVNDMVKLLKRGEELPPVIYSGFFHDGQHRMASHVELGRKKILAFKKVKAVEQSLKETPQLLQNLNQEDYDREVAFANEIIAGTKTLEDFEYYADYVETLQKETRFMKGNVVFIGSGAIPLSPILIEKKQHKVTGVDISQEANALGQKVLDAVGSKVNLVTARGEDYDYSSHDTIIVSLEAGVTVEQKEAIFEQIKKTAKLNATIIIRSSEGENTIGGFVNSKDVLDKFMNIDKTIPIFGGLSMDYIGKMKPSIVDVAPDVVSTPTQENTKAANEELSKKCKTRKKK
jgi:hypothetical protein